MDEGKQQDKPNPVLKANIISRSLYCWLNTLISEGNKRTLQIDDVYNILDEDSTEHLSKRLEIEWIKELEIHKQQQQEPSEEQLLNGKSDEVTVKQGKKEKKKKLEEPSLGRALKRTFRKVWWSWFLVAVFEEVVKVLQAVLLGGLIRYFSSSNTDGDSSSLYTVTTIHANNTYAATTSHASITYSVPTPATSTVHRVTTLEAYLYASSIGLLSIILAIVHHPYAFTMFRLGVWLRTACSALIYKKCLRLSNAVLSQTTVGHIVNLLSNDVQRFDLCMVFSHHLIIGPLEVIGVFVILWFMISWSAVSGMSLLVLILPILAMLSRCFAYFRGKTATFTDERVRLVNEMLNAMRLVKLYCWEPLFSSTISAARREEMKRIKKASIARSIAFGPFFYSGKMIIYVSLLTYVLMGNKLSAELVFVVISLYNVVRLIMTFFVPFGIQFGSEAKVTIQRVQAFLLQEERVQSDSIIITSINSTAEPAADKSTQAVKSSREPSLSLVNVTAAWSSRTGNNAEEPSGDIVKVDAHVNDAVLRDISVTIGSGQLLAVIGSVGSGKTSLLMALLGELPLASGRIEVRGRMAYVSQQAWVFSASVRQNIIFNSTFDPDRYNTAIQAAALKKDLELMPEGDRTLVGDRGVSLSGGQKARISLARAIYSNADIYLLDDPLSAVDTQVSKHIFNKCICGVLKKKPRVLVTHQLQYLQAADQILILSKDEDARLGSYDELCKGGVNIEQLLEKIKQEQEEQQQSKTRSPAAACKTRSPGHGTSPKPHGELNHSNELPDDKDRETDRLMRGHTDENTNKVKSANSTLSLTSFSSDVLFDDATEFRPEVQDEELRSGGTVSARLYIKYIYLGAGVFGLLVCALLNILSQFSYVLVDWWLAMWCNAIEEYDKRQSLYNVTVNNSSDLTTTAALLSEVSTTLRDADGTRHSPVDNMWYLMIFSCLTGAVVLFSQIRATHTFYILVRSADQLHKNMLAAVLRSPVAFFDSNPIGRILNRFSKDMGLIDEILPLFMYDLMQSMLLVLAVILVVGVVNPWVFIPTVPLCGLFLYLRNYFLKTARTLKRLEATSKSPVFSHISATVLGLHTVRSYGAEKVFTEEFAKHHDKNIATLYLYLITSRWFAVRLELICAFFITAVSIASVLAASGLNSGFVGLSLNYAITMMALFQWAVRQSSEVESTMTSVERLVEYSKLSPEAPWTSNQSDKLSKDWPSEGSITAEDLCLRYSPDGPLVLKHLSFNIKPGEKIGIVGRTGAGKSSLISVLFRLIEPSGQLIVDNVDVCSIGLHDLRTKISIIPQDPELFSGTVRRNLDPLGQKSDLQIWYALQQVQLKDMVEDMGRGLDSDIHEGGKNISMGERQLFCLARAILKSNRIMIIDEATANVDSVTDGLIQKTIREQFKDCTVLTIAHRLNTIIDCDRIMVMDEGSIKEFAAPHALLDDQDSLFYSMAQHLGQAQLTQLYSAAAAAAAKQRSSLM